MRGEYFNILDKLSSGDVYHLERSIDKFTEDGELKALQDEFLDLYSEFMQSKDEGQKQQLRALAKKIQSIDETFRFEIED